MNIAGMGSVSGFVKNMALQAKWQAKKQNITRRPMNDNPQIAHIKQWSEDQTRSRRIAAASSKLMSGAKLTPEDMETLRRHSPELYQKAVRIQREREAYKKALENSRSKEDVERLRMQKLNEFTTEIGAIRGNSNLSTEEKREQLEFLHMRMMAILDEHAAFTQTAKYQSLPDRSVWIDALAPIREKDECGGVILEIRCFTEQSPAAPSVGVCPFPPSRPRWSIFRLPGYAHSDSALCLPPPTPGRRR